MSNVSRERMKITAGMDLGDKYTHLCLLDTRNGEAIEESRLRTITEAMRRRPVRRARSPKADLRGGRRDA